MAIPGQGWMAWGALGLVWVPLLVLVVHSFNAARLGSGWGGFTWAWYRAAAGNEALRAAVLNSVILALSSTSISVVLGTLLGYGVGRDPKRAQGWREGLLRLPTVVPDIVSAISLVLFFSWVRRWLTAWEPGMTQMILGHVGLQLPFVALVVRARALSLDPALAEAARDLGATPARVFWHVTLPALRPGVVAGALLALTLSLDDFALSFFNGGPGSTTLPVYIYASARRGVSPEVNAAATVMLVLTAVLALVALRWQRRGRPLARGVTPSA
ncbi:MAG: ABC transporter permease [Verrucomicrobiales bacterium]|nr:ABC transporter permease [Verrucomicrobiales bacterium]